MPVIRKKNSGRHQESLRLGARAKRPCQHSEFEFTQRVISMKQLVSYKENID
ncbi:MAG: hypothetical protein ACRD22_18415 [Terriglobia bacterium]